MPLTHPPTTHLLEWVALLLTPGLGPTKARKLVGHFGSPENVFSAALTVAGRDWHPSSLGAIHCHRQID